jgi:CBS-domain-containing membrane protein
MMDDLNVGALPVCNGVSLIGMLTDRDIVVRAVSAGIAPTERIEGVVSGPPKWCFADDDVETVRKIIKCTQIRRVPVSDREKRLVGIVSLGDLATAADGACRRRLERSPRHPIQIVNPRPCTAIRLSRTRLRPYMEPT